MILIGDEPPRRLRSAVLLLIALLLAGAAHGREDAPPLSAVIERLALPGRLPSLRPSDLLDVAAELSVLYPGDDFEACWSGAAASPGAAARAVETLEHAEEWGLRAMDYDAAALRRLSLRLDDAAGDERAAFDVALSVSLLRFVGAVHGGRVAPAARAFDLGRSVPRTVDRVAVLRRFAAGVDPEEALSAVEPKLSLYRDLKSALRRYRTLAAQSASLPPLGELGTLHPGDLGVNLVGLRAMLALLGDLAMADAAADFSVYDETLVAALRRFQSRHGLDPDGVIGAQTRSALALPLARRVALLELNLERLRWLPESSGPLLLVNIPEFRLRAFADVDAEPVLEMRVVVGSAARKRETTVFAAMIRGVSFQPYWNVPTSITRGELLSRIEKDRDYLDRNDMEIVAPSPEGASQLLTASPQGLEALRSGKARLRQRPGARNSLGRVKFLMPNRYDIYLHDTPSVGLFQRPRRDFSHGCVRVEKPVDLALFVLAGVGDWDRRRVEAAMAAKSSRQVPTPAPLAVWLYYLTATASAAGEVSFFPDIYGHDDSLARRLQ